jgi:hypothetical protein
MDIQDVPDRAPGYVKGYVLAADFSINCYKIYLIWE